MILQKEAPDQGDRKISVGIFCHNNQGLILQRAVSYTHLDVYKRQQMTRPGERVQVDVKVVPRNCIADPELRLFQYTAIDEFTRLRFLAAYPEQSTYSLSLIHI